MNHPADLTAAGPQAPVLDGLNPAGPKLNRTCQACRARKIKCHLTPASPQCERCQKLSLACIFEPPATRRKRVRNETRIHHLERQLERLQAAVSETQGTSSTSSRSPGESSSATPGSASVHLQSGTLTAASDDPITAGIVDQAEAATLYSAFCTRHALLYPLVSPPPPESWLFVRQTRPALFRAILATASSSIRPDLWESLYRDTESYLVSQMMIDGQRSLQLVQAALILAIWHHPAHEFQNLKFNQMVSMAATAITDLRSSGEPEYEVPRPAAAPGPSPSGHLVELCRTYLATYFLCSSIATSFRRPSVLQYGPWVSDCLHHMSAVQSPGTGDAMLVAWVRLQRIAEESLAVVGMGSQVDVSDVRTQFIIQKCINQVLDWKQSTPQLHVNRAMTIHYYMVLLVLHEPSLYGAHEPEDFRPPYTVRSEGDLMENSVSAHPGDSIQQQCIGLADSLLREFLGYDSEELTEVPVILYIRMMHAVVVLVKLQSRSETAYSMESSTSTRQMIDALLEKLRTSARAGHFLLPRMFYFVLLQLSRWHGSSNQRPQSRREGSMQPLLGIKEAQQAGYSDHTGSDTMPGENSSSSETGFTPFQQENNLTLHHSEDNAQATFDLGESDLTSMSTEFLEQLIGSGGFDFMQHDTWQ